MFFVIPIAPVRTLVLMIFLLIGGIHSASAQYCRHGDLFCGGNRCCPAGTTCCYPQCCNAGATCTPQGCVPVGMWCGGSRFCHPGFHCSMVEGGCIPDGYTECGFHQLCAPGLRCATRGCAPADSVDCENGRWCPRGEVCAEGGLGCRDPSAVSPPPLELPRSRPNDLPALPTNEN